MNRWAFCDHGHVHRGTAVGAGILFRYVPPTYLLQQRSWWDNAGTWGHPRFGFIRT